MRLFKGHDINQVQRITVLAENTVDRWQFVGI